MSKSLKHQIEAKALAGFFACLRLLPISAASAVGGGIAQIIGPFFKAHRTAMHNLQRFLPQLDEPQRRRLLRQMWNNLGRTAAEMPHINDVSLKRRIEIEGAHHMPPPDTPALFFSAHLGNWELLPYAAKKHGVPITLVYRKANNPIVDRMIADMRSVHAGNMFPKGPTGAVKMARAIKNGEAIAMLADQKMNDGIAVPFFGVDAMTAPAIAQLSLRYDLPIIPARVVRTEGARFLAIVGAPLQIEKSGNKDVDIQNIMQAINTTIEGWIRETPEQWFWVHQRWPKSG